MQKLMPEFILLSVGCNSKSKASYWYNVFKQLCKVKNELRSGSKSERFTSKSLSEESKEKFLTPRDLPGHKDIDHEYYNKKVPQKIKRSSKYSFLHQLLFVIFMVIYRSCQKHRSY